MTSLRSCIVFGGVCCSFLRDRAVWKVRLARTKHAFRVAGVLPCKAPSQPSHEPLDKDTETCVPSLDIASHATGFLHDLGQILHHRQVIVVVEGTSVLAQDWHGGQL